MVAVICSVSGCSRFAAPRGRLDRSIYAPEGTAGSGGQYTIGVRDELEIFVWRCPELDCTVIVRPTDGRITLPLINDVKADGLTPRELAESISDKMAFYVKEPRVAVGVKKFGDKKVFILGQVLGQGVYHLEKEDRIIDIIARAGGFTASAVPSCTYIVRGNYEHSEIVRVNLGRFIHRGDVTQNVYLKEGDIVYVPEDELENLNYALRKIFPSLYFAEKLADLKQSIMTGGFDYKDVFRKRGFWQ